MNPGERSEVRGKNTAPVNWVNLTRARRASYEKDIVFLFLLYTTPDLIPLSEQSFEARYLGPQFPDQPHVGVLVNGGFVDDVFCAVSIAQRAQGLAVVYVRGRDG